MKNGKAEHILDGRLHQDIVKNYGYLEGRAKRVKALQDTISYIGWDEFERLVQICHENRGITRLNFERSLQWGLGISGYPIRAIWEHCYGEDTWPQKDSGSV